MYVYDDYSTQVEDFLKSLGYHGMMDEGKYFSDKELAGIMLEQIEKYNKCKVSLEYIATLASHLKNVAMHDGKVINILLDINIGSVLGPVFRARDNLKKLA